MRDNCSFCSSQNVNSEKQIKMLQNKKAETFCTLRYIAIDSWATKVTTVNELRKFCFMGRNETSYRIEITLFSTVTGCFPLKYHSFRGRYLITSLWTHVSLKSNLNLNTLYWAIKKVILAGLFFLSSFYFVKHIAFQTNRCFPLRFARTIYYT